MTEETIFEPNSFGFIQKRMKSELMFSQEEGSTEKTLNTEMIVPRVQAEIPL